MSGEKVRCMIGGVVGLLMVGCASTPATEVPTATNTPPMIVHVTGSPLPTENQATAQAASIATLQANRTAVAQSLTGTPTITPTFYPTADLPDVPLSREGPWLVFLAASEECEPRCLWAINNDGTGLTRLVDEPVAAFDIKPNASTSLGVTIAYVAYTKSDMPGYILKLLSLPDNRVTPVTPLLGGTSTLEGIWSLDETIGRDGLKWSPGGSLLAFVGALNGPSVDVYTYDFFGGIITRLSDQPSHAYQLNWSPDGHYLVYEGLGDVLMDRAFSTAYWAVKADGTGTTRLIEEADIKDNVYTKGWISSREIMLVNQLYPQEGENSDIRTVNLETGETTSILEEPFADAAFATEHNTWLLTTSYNPTAKTPLILYQQEKRQEIPGQGINHVQWLSEYDVFLGQTDNHLFYTITPEGKITELPIGTGWNRWPWPYSMLTSPDGQNWTWYMLDWQALASELWVGSPMTEPVKILSTADNRDSMSSDIVIIDGFDWSPDSQRLLILTDHGLWMAERPDFEAVLVSNRLCADPRDRWEGEWIP